MLLTSLLLLACPGWSQSAEELDGIRTRAVQGDLEAQNALGNAHTNGLYGLQGDFTEALKWYRQAGDKGYAPAQFNLGLAYELGRGVAVDERQAFKFYLMAAEQGYVPAQFNTGNMYSAGRGIGQDYFEANLWYKQAADNGLAEAQFNLGLAYEAGQGVKKDEAQAARWYRQAADQGYPRAQYNLGILLDDGRGVARDATAAAGFYRAAADQGFAPAQVNYGLILSEGRPGVARDPVQALVWLSRAVKNGSSPEARDALAGKLTPEQVAAASRLLGAGMAVNPAMIQSGSAASANDSIRLVDQLREQSRRLASQVETLNTGKEAADRQVVLMTAQIKDLQQELQQAKAAGTGPVVPAVDVSRYQAEVASLTTKLDQASAALKQSEQAQAQLTAENQRLQQAKAALSAAARPEAPATDAGMYPVLEGDRSGIVANLQRDNARLNDEVKRSTRELLSLNQQLRNLRSQPANAATSAPADTDSGLMAQLTTKAQRLEADNQRLTARVAELERAAQTVANATLAPQLAQGGLTAEQQQQLRTLQDEKNELEKWSGSLEKTLNEKTASVALLETTVADLRSKALRTEQQLEERGQALTGQVENVARLSAENKDLQARLARADEQWKTVASRPADTTETDNLRQRLAEREKELAAARATGARVGEENERLQAELATAGRRVGQLSLTVEELTRTNDGLQKQLEVRPGPEASLAPVRAELAQAQSRITSLEHELSRARQQVDEGARQLEKNLAAATQAAADSTARREELNQARSELADMVALRDENARLRPEAAATASLRMKGEQLGRDADQLTAALNGSRHDLEQARGRVAELEKQLADALTVRTRGGENSRKSQADLAEANRTVEKLNATVAELTVANEKLEQDLESAQKSTAAALAAQSQAVSAASPDAYQMEISTLNARIKQLDAQVEEERASSAREVSTLAAQMQRLRETNKSLTDANRALLSAQESDTAATRDDIAQLQGRVHELTAANEELRRAGQKQAADLRSLAGERDSLQSQLVDARKVATTLPALADDKAALQERLETVGGQLVQLQSDQDELQKNNAELTQQLAASQQATEKAQADLAALQGRASEAEKAAESHNTSVAELTQENTKLEQQREDMRRLVESYRADIARLTQTARAAEQQKAEAERSGQQNVDAVTAQLGQLRREVEAARTAQARLTENFAAQDRERTGIINQLRTENSALAARLNQAQGTLDQIASAARLGTPAATIASGGLAPVRPGAIPVVSTAEVRYHTVAEGDSLSRISMRYYGTPNRWQEIFQANRDVLQGSSALRIGMQLRIP